MNKIVITFCMVLASYNVMAQASSPYNRYGLGSLNNQATTSNRSLGGVSAAYSNMFNINSQNPASHADLFLTTFEIGADGEHVSIQSKDSLYKSGTSSLSHISLGFPVKLGKWGAALTFKPYSSVNYAFDRKIIDTNLGNYNEFYTGSGKLYNFSLGNGVRFKNLYIGANIGFVFGKIDYAKNIIFTDDTKALNTRFANSNSIRGITYNLGLMYKVKLYPKAKDKKSNYLLTLGAYGSSSTKPIIKSTKHWERFDITSNGIVPVDTISSYIKEKGYITIPANFAVGATIQNGEKWLISADIKYTLWKNYKSTLDNFSMNNNLRCSVGLEYSPDKDANRKFFKYISYRIGGYGGTSELVVKGVQLSEAGVTIGLGIPVRSKGVQYSMANLGFEYGTRGTTSSNLYRESYYRFSLGIVFNDRWFIKRRFD
ncbi:MAG: hypothetical protein WCP57_08310 [Bacteroidota bacterium]